MGDRERVAASVRCRECLDDLSDFVDGTLTPERLEGLRHHLERCDRCDQFGERFAHLVETVRQLLASSDPVTPDVAARLRTRLQKEFGRGARPSPPELQ